VPVLRHQSLRCDLLVPAKVHVSANLGEQPFVAVLPLQELSCSSHHLPSRFHVPIPMRTACPFASHPKQVRAILIPSSGDVEDESWRRVPLGEWR
jgi:hypothetical protein